MPTLRIFPWSRWRRVRAAVRLLTPVLAAACVGACVTDAQPGGRSAAPAPAPAPPQALTAPLLGPGDQLRVIVYGEDRLSGPVMIGQDGRIDLPVAGAVEVAGLTTQEAAARIAARLKGRMLLEPRVTVTVAAWRPVYVTGEVERAGEYPWRPGLNLMSAVAMAGGATRRASHADILVQRQGVGPLVAMPLSPETPVLPGDLLKLPERLF